VPWPVRRGGVVLRLYEHSLSISLFTLFLLSFVLHARGGARHHNEEVARHGGELTDTFSFMGSADFWEQSFQNWQSEFLSVAVLVLLSIWLREHGSPQSKAVADPHDKTGDS
jgi:hypothetical protein